MAIKLGSSTHTTHVGRRGRMTSQGGVILGDPTRNPTTKFICFNMIVTHENAQQSSENCRGSSVSLTQPFRGLPILTTYRSVERVALNMVQPQGCGFEFVYTTLGNSSSSTNYIQGPACECAH
jgi:hypothetical protein